MRKYECWRMTCAPTAQTLYSPGLRGRQNAVRDVPLD
jgi:hypothetical protein